MFGIWGTFSSVVFYLTLAVGLGGLLGNALVLWHLGFHIKKGPFAIYVLHLAAADFLFLGCQLAFSAVQAALGSEHSLYFAVSFVAFSVGLWLLAAFSAERCLSDLFPACYQGCRPRHTSGVVCGLSWALAPPAVLLTADACGLLRKSARPLACLRYHATSVAGLLALACAALAAGLVLFIWVVCCSQRQRPRFYGAVLGSGLLLLVCGLPYLLCWTLRPYLPSFLLSTFLPLATLLACVHCSARPLIYFTVGRQPGRRETLRAVLRRSLGEGVQLGDQRGLPAHGLRTLQDSTSFPGSPTLGTQGLGAGRVTSSTSPDCGEPRLQKEKQSTSPTCSPRKEAGGQAGRGRTVTFVTFRPANTSGGSSGPGAGRESGGGSHQEKERNRRGPPEELKALDPGTGQVCASHETAAGPGTAGEGIPVTFSPGWPSLWFRSE
ncbi:mas-related G-protein coupled receptor member G [Muntiacus reevesi]|uniref:mas-related G-protein coupled receptor member G n=1 Tax=Muntiacus reevesi TaxID=9886 RepID=UPI0033075A11